MSDVRIRRLEEPDLVELAQLCAEHAAYERAPRPAALEDDAGPERLGELLLRRAHALCLVVALPREGPARSRLGGFASAFLENSTWDAGRYLHLDCLYLREPYRGRGLGRRLMQSIARAAVGLEAVHLQWQTPAWNEAAARFYGRLGAGSQAKLRFTLDADATAALAADPQGVR